MEENESNKKENFMNIIHETSNYPESTEYYQSKIKRAIFLALLS